MLFVPDYCAVIESGRSRVSEFANVMVISRPSKRGGHVDRLLTKLLLTVIGITLAVTVGAAYF